MNDWLIDYFNINHLIKHFATRMGFSMESMYEFTFCQKSTGNWSIKHKLFIIYPNLSFEKRKKSAGAILGEYGVCSMIFVEFLSTNSFTMIALWDRALSWCKIHEFSFHKSVFFRRNYSLKRFIALKKYSLFFVWPSNKNFESTTPR